MTASAVERLNRNLKNLRKSYGMLKKSSDFSCSLFPMCLIRLFQSAKMQAEIRKYGSGGNCQNSIFQFSIISNWQNPSISLILGGEQRSEDFGHTSLKTMQRRWNLRSCGIH